MSCCEEQEAREAEVRSKLRAATAWNESRLLARHIQREELHRALRCGNGCACFGCGECEPEEEAASAEAPAPVRMGDEDSSDIDSFDDSGDDDEAALMAKMRAVRMGQLRAVAEAASRRGTHSRLRDEESLASLLADTSDSSPIVLHLTRMDGHDESEMCLRVEDVFRKAASKFPSARLITDPCASHTPPDFLAGSVTALPALLTIERGVVTSICPGTLRALREPEEVKMNGVRAQPIATAAYPAMPVHPTRYPPTRPCCTAGPRAC